MKNIFTLDIVVLEHNHLNSHQMVLVFPHKHLKMIVAHFSLTNNRKTHHVLRVAVQLSAIVCRSNNTEKKMKKKEEKRFSDGNEENISTKGHGNDMILFWLKESFHFPQDMNTAVQDE